MTPLINERVDHPVNSGLVVLCKKNNEICLNFYLFSIFDDSHYDCMFAEVYDTPFHRILIFFTIIMLLFSFRVTPVIRPQSVKY